MLHHDTLDNVHMCDKCYAILCNEESNIVMILKFDSKKYTRNYYQIKVLMFENIFHFYELCLHKAFGFKKEANINSHNRDT